MAKSTLFWKTATAWVIAVLLAASFLTAGYIKIPASDSMVRRFEAWGYSTEFVWVIGSLELLAGLLVLIPRISFYGASLIVILMIGATYTHLSTGIGSPIFALIYLMMGVTLAFLRFKDAYFVKHAN